MDVSRHTRAALPAPRVPDALDGGLGFDDLARNPDTQPYAYSSSNPGVAKVLYPNQGMIQGVSNGNATITASDNAGASGSYPVNVSSPPFVPDFTDFTGYNWNGWERGPAGNHTESIIVLDQGNYRYRNRTPPGATNAGVALQKRYSFNIGKRYAISMYVLSRHEVTPRPHDPVLSVNASSTVVIPARRISEGNWTQMTGQFTATVQDAWIQIISHEGTSDGNDYEIDNISVSQLD